MSDKQEKSFDIRIVSKNLRRGTVSKQDYEKFLKSLPDDSGNYQEIQTTQEKGPSSPPEDL